MNERLERLGRLEKTKIELYRKQLGLDHNKQSTELRTIEDAVKLIAELSTDFSNEEDDFPEIIYYFQPNVAKKHLEWLRAFWAYRKLNARDGYDNIHPFRWYDDFFVGKEHITSNAFEFIKNRCLEYKKIRDLTVLLANKKYLDQDLISLETFFKSSKKIEWIMEFIEQTELFYVNIPLYIENKKVEVRQFETSPYFDDIDFDLDVSEENRFILSEIFLLDGEISKSGYSDYFSLVEDVDFAKKFMIDHTCFSKDAKNIHIKKAIINDYKNITSTCFLGGLLTYKKMEPNYYYHFLENVQIPIGELYVEKKLAEATYKKILLSNNIDPVLSMNIKDKRNYYIIEALRKGYLNDVIEKWEDSIAILNIYKQDLFDKLAKQPEFTEDQKSLFKSNIKTNEHFKANPDLQKYLKVKTGRPSGK